MCAAVAGGEEDFVAIAVKADSDEPIVPCGACRQFLAEFNPDLIIVRTTVLGQAEDRKSFASFRRRDPRNSKAC
jgi:cytidine deaminase